MRYFHSHFLSKAIIFIYLTSLSLLLFYSYSQIDLNLTLFSNSTYQFIQNQLICLGYFQRPLSTLIYIVILSFLFISYIGLIYLSKTNLIKLSNIIKLSLTTTIILLFAYPAFSHDIFNYIFDARILLHHHQNPYLFTALDFPNDLWTRFMHWTHRTYPYGPAWLFLTLPFYILGLGKFSLTLLSFKLLGALSYFFSVFLIYKITSNLKTQTSNLSLVLFAFNPLVIIESLVSSHLDIVMVVFMLLSLHLYKKKQQLTSLVALVFSALIKYVSSVVFVPLALSKFKKLEIDQIIKLAFLISLILTLYVISRREVLPWYFLTPISLLVLTKKPLRSFWFILPISIFTLSRYIPTLFLGETHPNLPAYKHFIDMLTLVSVILSFVLFKLNFFNRTSRHEP